MLMPAACICASSIAFWAISLAASGEAAATLRNLRLLRSIGLPFSFSRPGARKRDRPSAAKWRYGFSREFGEGLTRPHPSVLGPVLASSAAIMAPTPGKYRGRRRILHAGRNNILCS